MQIPKKQKNLIRVLFTVLFLFVFHVQSFATIWYVKPTSTGSGNGTSWANASANIQTIINGASSGDQIWFAQGTYITPGGGGVNVNNFTTTYSFQFKDGVEMYGGFNGTETLLSQRNYEQNETKLVGDGNAVFIGDGTLSRNTRLDGFSILNGRSSSFRNGGGIDLGNGGGFRLDVNSSSSPTIQHCKFYDNISQNGGGAMSVINQSSPLIIDCIFYNNQAFSGGAIYISNYAYPEIVNCTFYNNVDNYNQTWYGDAIHSTSQVRNGNITKISNCILFGNGNNEIYEETPGYLTVNYSNIRGGYPTGTGNINLDPLFVDASAGNFKLAYNSPSVQAGNNATYNNYAVLNNSMDLAGNSRLSSNLTNSASNIDMGAFQYIVTAPSNLSYNSPNYFTKNISAVNLIPTLSGTPTSSFTIDKVLPTGLSFNTTNGAITGIPNQNFSPTVFTITTSNYVGTTSCTVHITVNELMPRLSYTTPVVYTIGQTLSPTLSPINIGGDITGGLIAQPVSQNLGMNAMSYSVMDNLGNMYIVKDVTGEIYKRSSSGNLTLYAAGIESPTGITIDPSGNLYVTSVSSINGRKLYKIDINAQVSILNHNAELNFIYPMGIKYGDDGYVYIADMGADKIIKVDIVNGVQTVLASNIAPSNVAYSGPTSLIKDQDGNWIVFNKDATISKVSPLGIVTQNYINTGAYLSDFTGPYDVTKDANGNLYVAGYQNVIIKINSIGDPTFFATIPGSTHTLMGINFNPLGELFVTYRNVGTNNASIYRYSPGKLQIQPTLPAGLEFNTETGVISGIPTVITPAINYTIAATNSGGTFTTTVNLEIKGTIIYTSPNIYTKGTAITSLTPNTNGVSANTYSITPTLPAGLSIDGTTGVISGTPTTLSAQAEYTVRAITTSGNLEGKLTITVNDIAPSNLSYTTPNVFTKGTAILSLTPTVGGGVVTNYSISPNLPAGISINAVSGVISGTPTAISSAGVYTVTASNTGGTVSFGLSITVNDVAPSNLRYTSPKIYTKGAVIPTLSPTVTGGAIISYAVNPTLPTGLTLDTLNGNITGRPTNIVASSIYTVTATNSGGSTSFGVDITVNDVPPTGISYVSPATLFKNKPANGLTPSQTGGGVVTNYAISPTLPSGLTIDAISGVITGTSTVLSDPTDYTVTASNSGGSTTAVVNIKVILYLFAKDSILQHNKCVNDSIGDILVTAQGGYAPYVFSMNGGAYQSSGSFKKLPSGIYRFSLKDSTGAEVQITDTVKTLSSVPIKTYFSQINNKCFGDALGAITIDSITGGVAPFKYLWSSGTNVANGIVKLAKGEYLFNVQDFYGCQDSAKFIITEPAKLSITATVTDPLCYNQSNGVLSTAVSGGTVSYTYLWSNGGTTNRISNLAFGTYSLKVTDAMGCIQKDTFNLKNPLLFKIELDSIVTICTNQVYKKDFKNINYPTAGFSWSSDNGYTSSSTILSVNKAGSYFVKGINPNGCISMDTLVMKMQNNTIESVFALATNVFQNDTIHIVNISNPKPEKSIWTYSIDTAIKLIYKNEDSLRLKFINEGTYTIQLNTKIGACVDSSVQTVHILKSSGINVFNIVPLGLNSIQNLKISPNPNRGQFNVSLNLQKSSSIAIRILNISNGRLVYSKQYPSSTYFNIPFNLLLSADIYALIIETEFGATSVSKIMIL